MMTNFNDILDLPTKWYHGTHYFRLQGIIENGIDLSKSRKRLDYGPGFYLTTNFDQAVKLLDSDRFDLVVLDINIPGGNSRGTQRPDLVPGVDPYLKDGVRWLNPAAFTTPQPGTFGNLPRNFLRGPNFYQVDLMFSKDLRILRDQAFQVRVEIFNIANRLNYENPAVSLPNGTVGVPFTDAQAGTFGYMLGPLNRTVGLGTARQTQVSLRYTF